MPSGSLGPVSGAIILGVLGLWFFGITWGVIGAVAGAILGGLLPGLLR